MQKSYYNEAKEKNVETDVSSFSQIDENNVDHTFDDELLSEESFSSEWGVSMPGFFNDDKEQAFPTAFSPFISSAAEAVEFEGSDRVGKKANKMDKNESVSNRRDFQQRLSKSPLFFKKLRNVSEMISVIECNSKRREAIYTLEEEAPIFCRNGIKTGNFYQNNAKSGDFDKNIIDIPDFEKFSSKTDHFEQNSTKSNDFDENSIDIPDFDQNYTKGQNLDENNTKPDDLYLKAPDLDENNIDTPDFNQNSTETDYSEQNTRKTDNSDEKLIEKNQINITMVIIETIASTQRTKLPDIEKDSLLAICVNVFEKKFGGEKNEIIVFVVSAPEQKTFFAEFFSLLLFVLFVNFLYYI